MNEIAIIELPPRHLQKIAARIKKEPEFFQEDECYLARRFIALVLERELGDETIERFRAAFLERIRWHSREYPTEEKAFYLEICKIFLCIKEAPRRALLRIYRETIADLSAVRQRLKKYRQERDDLEKKGKQPNNSLNNDETVKINMLRHYIDRNETALEEIICFLDTSIERCALEEVSIWGGIRLFEWDRYSYRLWKQSYIMECFSRLENKFGYTDEYDHVELMEIEQEIRNDPARYSEVIQNYLKKTDVCAQIREMVQKHHRLAIRQHVIEGALGLYSRGEKLLFCNIAPLQIEGIVHDYCLEIGISEHDIQREKWGLTKKALKIHATGKHFYFYEYYAIWLPGIRNQIAHGKLLNTGEIELIADELLLDLSGICMELTKNTRIRTNAILTAFKKYCENPSTIKATLQSASLLDHDLPDFYGLGHVRTEVQNKIQTPEFAVEVEQLCSKHCSQTFFDGIRTIAAKITNKPDRDRIYKAMEKRKAKPFNKKQFDPIEFIEFIEHYL